MNKLKQFFKPKPPLFKWWVGRIFLGYILVALIGSFFIHVISPIFEKLTAPKIERPTEEQWRGYSRCLERQYQNESTMNRRYLCRIDFQMF